MLLSIYLARLFYMKGDNIIKIIIKKILLITIIIYLSFYIIFGVKRVDNHLMKPNINPGDLIIYYRLDNEYYSEEVIIFQIDNKEYLGRIIGIPGDKIEITDDSKLLVNDSLLNEDNIYYETYMIESNIKYPIYLKDNEYFILSDNRINSYDSRYFGPINQTNIKGNIISLIRKNNI